MCTFVFREQAATNGEKISNNSANTAIAVFKVNVFLKKGEGRILKLLCILAHIHAHIWQWVMREE
jgi:hypothetical protein